MKNQQERPLNTEILRKFICKRCGKKSTDKKGGFSIHSEKHNVDLIYENIDLCDRCFKKTTREEKNLKYLQEAITRGLINQNDIPTLKKFQTNLCFRKEILEKIGVIKNNSVQVVEQAHPPSYYKRLAKRKKERETK